MSYQVLARRWRPQNFEQMVGQQHVLKSVIHALEQQRIHHAYLFSGTRGVGKTTIARIFAKSLNCEAGISAKPCGQCSTCLEIQEGRYADLIEIDAASRTRVEDTRELLDNVQYAPTRGRYKIYLIDEVHMLSGHSFNALLKTLEEPPEHVKFLLATTDPQKLPITILSRCLQLHLKPINESAIVGQLTHILQQEKIDFEDQALMALARAAAGSLRDALSLLDQAISFGQGAVNADSTEAMLGCVGHERLFAVLNALAAEDGQALAAQFQQLSEDGVDYDELLKSLIRLLAQVAALQVIPEPYTQEFDMESLQAIADVLTPEQVQLFYEIFLRGRRDLPYAASERSGFEMSALRCLAFHRVDAQVPAAIPVAAEKKSIKSKAPVSPVTMTPPTAPISEPTKPKSEPIKQAKPKATGQLTGDWAELLQQLPLSGMAKQVAYNCHFVAHENGCLRLRTDRKHAVMVNPRLLATIAQVLSEYTGETVKVDIATEANDVKQPQQQTPAEQQKQQQQERQKAAEAELLADKSIQYMQAEFGATIEPDSINVTEESS